MNVRPSASTWPVLAIAASAFVALAAVIDARCVGAATGDAPSALSPDELQASTADGAPTAEPASEAPSAPLSAAQLDQLTAPIALYPDPLVAQILTAATYPLEIVEAARWLSDPANSALHGDALTAALQGQPWDMSVKSVVPFADVLRRMNDDLQWTEQIGDAFLAQPNDVMDSIQRLRRDAISADRLESTPQQTVRREGEDLTIEPADPGIVYVPSYDPSIVFGPWPWPGYPPYYFPPFAGTFYPGVIGFGVGIAIVGPLWGWCNFSWPARRLIIPRYGHRPPQAWTHDPAHRRAVPYRNPRIARRYLGAGATFRPGFRGYAASPRPQAAPAAPRVPRAIAAPRAPPVFESFGRGPQVRGEAARGLSSRSAPRAAQSGTRARGSSTDGRPGGRRR